MFPEKMKQQAEFGNSGDFAIFISVLIVSGIAYQTL